MKPTRRSLPGKSHDTDRGAAIASRVDIGILTIREDEFRAVLAVFPGSTGSVKGARTRREYALRVADAGLGAQYRLAVLRQIEQGNGEAQSAARDLIEDLAPRLILVVGIAGSLPSAEVTLGDVVISTRIHDFTVEARSGGEDPTYSTTGGPVPKALAAAIANLAAREGELGDWTADLAAQPTVSWQQNQLYGPTEWQDELRARLEKRYSGAAAPRVPRYADGPIASSDRLVTDPAVLIPLLQTARKLLAVEMESGGVYRAAQERCPMVAIRGISDIVGLRRAEAWTRYACGSAAAFARAFLRTRPVEVIDPGPRGRGQGRGVRRTHPARPGAATGGSPVVSGSRPPQGPEAAALAQRLLQEMHLWLLEGFAADAVIRAAAVVDVALEVLAGIPVHADRDLGAPVGTQSGAHSSESSGALIHQLRRTGRNGATAEASWVNQLRVTNEPLAGRLCPERDAEARHAGEIATRLAQDAGLVTASEVAACERDAALRASEPASRTLLLLDRRLHRHALEDRLDRPPRVLVVLVHGESDQGHDHFADIMTWKLRSASRRWRQLAVVWPKPSPVLGLRLPQLLEQLAHRLGVALGAPHDDPTSPHGARAWQPAFDRIITGVAAVREPLLVSHVVGCLGCGAGGDDALVDAYVRHIWNAVAHRPGPPVVVSLDLRRIERGGFPLGARWRNARRELATARAIERILAAHHASRGSACVALPELTSVPVDELADWLHVHADRDRDTARSEAHGHLGFTRGGRFDLVVQRLIAHHLDRQWNPR